MLIAYFSATGKIKKFLQKTGYDHLYDISEKGDVINEPFILMTGTVGIGEIHPAVASFVKQNHSKMQAVIGSGNKNWGANYCKAAIEIADHYKVPLLFCYESAGNTHDIAKFNETIKQYQ